MARRRTVNRKSRLDPSKPKLPPTCAVVLGLTEIGNEVTLTATEPMQYNESLADFDGAGKALPGVILTPVAGPAQAPSNVNLTEGGQVATLQFGALTAAAGTLSISPLTQALKSIRGGVIAIGESILPAE